MKKNIVSLVTLISLVGLVSVTSCKKEELDNDTRFRATTEVALRATMPRPRSTAPRWNG